MQYGKWHSCFPLGLRERRTWLHPVWGDHGFEYRWKQFFFACRLVEHVKRLVGLEIVIEETTDMELNIVQTVQRRDGSEYERVRRYY